MRPAGHGKSREGASPGSDAAARGRVGGRDVEERRGGGKAGARGLGSPRWPPAPRGVAHRCGGLGRKRSRRGPRRGGRRGERRFPRKARPGSEPRRGGGGAARGSKPSSVAGEVRRWGREPRGRDIEARVVERGALERQRVQGPGRRQRQAATGTQRASQTERRRGREGRRDRGSDRTCKRARACAALSKRPFRVFGNVFRTLL